MPCWKSIAKDPPESGKVVLGWDAAYRCVLLAGWNGRIMLAFDNLDRDVDIIFWHPLPDPPTQAEIESEIKYVRRHS